jgi:hypothetical protein
MSSRWRGPRAPRRADDDGQVVLLIIGFTVIAALLITVVVNVSRVFLVQRGLGAAADGAAVSAAGAVDEAAVYTGGIGDGLPLDPGEARGRVADYAAAGGLADRFEGFRVDRVEVTGDRATVTFSSVVRLPFQALVPGRYRNGVPVTVTASARSPVGAP